MYKKSHKALTTSLMPLFFINIPENNFNVINTLSETYNSIIQNTQDLATIPLFIFFIFLGTLFPDLDMKLKILFPGSLKNERFRYHRQITHSLILSIGLLFYSLYFLPKESEYFYLLTGFSLGIISHQIGDMLTGSVPILLYGPYYVRFSRLGITVFLPKVLHYIFTEKLPKLCDKYLYYIFIPIFLINIYILYIFRLNTII